MSANKAIIIAARRTAIGRIGGLHRARTIDRLAAPIINAVLLDAGLEGNCVDEVILGNAVGGGGNPARLIALTAGLPENIPAYTIDRQCASGLDAVIAAARSIETGAADAVIAGGVESASTAPWRIAKPANLYTGLPRFFAEADFAPASSGDPSMLEAAENVARAYKISRERQDGYALESHRRAVAAQQGGLLRGEILPLGSEPEEFTDEGPRAKLSAALLARMPPLQPNGTVTAGNSCQINDGAAMVLMVSSALHLKMGSPPGLAFIGAASAGVSPELPGTAAIPAFEKLRAQYSFRQSGLSAVELNEAFAAQTLATVEQLNLDMQSLNALGGAIAFGHPYGASGAVLAVRLFTRLIRKMPTMPDQQGVAMVAAAGGVGVAALFRSAI